MNDWNGHIVIQENPTRVRTKIANSTGRWSHPSWSSLDKSADESLLNERCEVSFYSDFSSKKVFHSQDTSLLSIGKINTLSLVLIRVLFYRQIFYFS